MLDYDSNSRENLVEYIKNQLKSHCVNDNIFDQIVEISCDSIYDYVMPHLNLVQIHIEFS